MILFLINTPAQAINAAVLSMMKFKSDRCIAYYTGNIAKEMQEFYKEGVFSEIFEIELVKDIASRKNIILRSIVRIKNAIDIKIISERLPNNVDEITHIFASGVSLRNFEIYYAIKAKNPNVRFSLYEEGICEYYFLGMKRNWPKILFSMIFFRRYYLYDCESVYVYNPENVKNIWKNIKLEKIPDYVQENSVVKMINKAVGYKEVQMKNNHGQYVVIEQAFASEKYEKKQKELIDLLVKKVGKDNVVLKLHPRSEIDKYGEGYNILNTNIPLEIIALNEELSSNVFVSMTSSAVLNFKQILNQELDVILLYELIGKKWNRNNEIIQLFKRVKYSYSKGMFEIPTSIEEYLDILSSRGV